MLAVHIIMCKNNYNLCIIMMLYVVTFYCNITRAIAVLPFYGLTLKYKQKHVLFIHARMYTSQMSNVYVQAQSYRQINL